MDTPQAQPVSWPLAKRIGFRFVFCYGLIYFSLAPLGEVAQLFQWGDKPNVLFQLMGWYERQWRVIEPWVGKHVLRLPKDITIFPGGSGDTTYNYVELFTHGSIALAATLVWSLVDYRRKSYPLLYGLLRVYLRYTLAFIMLGYGFVKVFKSQFPAPGPDRLIEPLGEMSPMGLLWTFMGHSTMYTIFAGLGEVIGGSLLFFRRTCTLGALITAGVMANVVAMNFSYDVPVKLYSAHLLLTAMFLAAHDSRRVLNVLVLNRDAPAAIIRPPRAMWKRVALGVGKWAVALYAIGAGAWGGYRNYHQYGDGAPNPPLFGLYEVESFTINGEEKPALVTDKDRWRRVAMNKYKRFTVESMPGPMERFDTVVDEEKKTIVLTPRVKVDPVTKEERKPFTVTFDAPDADHLTIEGDYFGSKVVAKSKRIDFSSFLLINRGFHWVNEFPFNK